MKLSDLFLLIFCGFGLHQSARVTRRMPNGWEQLTNYAIGYEGSFVAFAWLLRRLRVPAEIAMIVSAAYQVAGLLVGIGVALGWLADEVIKPKSELLIDGLGDK